MWREIGGTDCETTEHHDRKNFCSENSAQLFVDNLASISTWMDLKDHFKQCGDIIWVNIHKNGHSGVVKFSKAQDASKATKTLNRSILKGSIISVRQCQKKPCNVLHTTKETEVQQRPVEQCKKKQSFTESTRSVSKFLSTETVGFASSDQVCTSSNTMIPLKNKGRFEIPLSSYLRR